ncbi:hypothetical protein [Melittangium boletus]|uniref:Uncharacterized protein n=1 Tax=Melittangium boletus DSM 14713 TaxID=1294270 RepID=A0A250ICW5_9BACT|nr:hypothetical protein [Melittangium boletus]ATB29605.1 hypothetical protein MEBOL_003060 [Melittangium boletus DSM 14713]
MNTELIKSTLNLLHEVGRHASTPEQHEALENARLALYFIEGRSEAGPFADYLEKFDAESRRPLIAFETKDEADAWLRNHPAPPHGATIGAAGSLYTLAYLRELEHRKLLRVLTDKELTRTDDAEVQAEEKEDERPPPHWSHRSMFSVFGFANWSFFHLHQLEQRLSSPEEIDALRVAKLAFHFVMDVGEDHGFEEYRRTLLASRTSHPLQSFATREEADTWLATQPEPPPPAVVAIGGDLYSVGYNRLKRYRVMIRIPTQQELDPRVA